MCGREPPRMADYGNTWTLVEWMELLDSLSSLFRLAVGKKTPDEEVRPSSMSLEQSFEFYHECLTLSHVPCMTGP